MSDVPLLCTKIEYRSDKDLCVISVFGHSIIEFPREALLRLIIDAICEGMPAVFEDDDGERYQVTALSPPDDECIMDEAQTSLFDYSED